MPTLSPLKRIAGTFREMERVSFSIENTDPPVMDVFMESISISFCLMGSTLM